MAACGDPAVLPARAASVPLAAARPPPALAAPRLSSPPPPLPPQVVDVLAKSILADIKLGHEVKQVTRSSTGVTVAATAAGKALSFTAKHVVVSVPLGVLKAGKIAFSPALSATKAVSSGRHCTWPRLHAAGRQQRPRREMPC